MHRSRFTLIELLVVVAIIAVLAALLLPALGRAKRTAQRTVCMNNMKQVGTALFMYADEWDDFLPSEYDTSYPNYYREWTSRLKPYIGVRESTNISAWSYEELQPIFQCPSSDVALAIKYNGNQSMQAMNARLSRYKLGKIKAAGDLVLLADPKPWLWDTLGPDQWKIDRTFSRAVTTGFTLTTGGRAGIGNTHPGNGSLAGNPVSGGANLVYADGSGFNVNNRDIPTSSINPALQ